jgi:hypothetical protein
MKITAGENQRKAPRGNAYIVTGIVEYESNEILGVVTSRKLARLAIDSDKAIRKAANRWAFDNYGIQKFQLDTAVYRSDFFTQQTIRTLP